MTSSQTFFATGFKFVVFTIIYILISVLYLLCWASRVSWLKIKVFFFANSLMTNNPINWWIRQMIRCVSKILPTDWMNASMQWVSLHSPDEWKWTLARTAPFLHNNTKTLKLKLNHFTKKTSLLLCQFNYNDDVLRFQKQQSILMFQERRGRAWRRARSLLLLGWPAKLKERVVVVVVEGGPRAAVSPVSPVGQSGRSKRCGG